MATGSLHCPPKQCTTHVLPHTPQLNLSFIVSTHVEPQSVSVPQPDPDSTPVSTLVSPPSPPAAPSFAPTVASEAASSPMLASTDPELPPDPEPLLPDPEPPVDPDDPLLLDPELLLEDPLPLLDPDVLPDVELPLLDPELPLDVEPPPLDPELLPLLDPETLASVCVPASPAAASMLASLPTLESALAASPAGAPPSLAKLGNPLLQLSEPKRPIARKPAYTSLVRIDIPLKGGAARRKVGGILLTLPRKSNGNARAKETAKWLVSLHQAFAKRSHEGVRSATLERPDGPSDAPFAPSGAVSI